MLNYSAFATFLKRAYAPVKVKEMLFSDRPLLGMINKTQLNGGESFSVTTNIVGQGVSSNNFGIAQANATAFRSYRFIITPYSSVYTVQPVDNKLIAISESNVAALQRAFTTAMDIAIEEQGKKIHEQLYRSEMGIMKATTVLASTTLVLTNPADISHFAVGQIIKLIDPATNIKRAGSLVIAGLDFENGMIEFAAGTNIVVGIGAAAWLDKLYAEGTDMAEERIVGLDRWFPIGATRTAQLTAAFYSLVRLADTRLGGIVYDGSGDSYEEMFTKGTALLSRCGGGAAKLDAFVNPEIYSEILLALGTKVVYVNPKSSDAEVNFEGIKIHGSSGTVTIIPDWACPVDRIYVLNMDTINLDVVGGELIRVQDSITGLKAIPGATTDSVELRLRTFCQFWCSQPGRNLVISL